MQNKITMIHLFAINIHNLLEIEQVVDYFFLRIKKYFMVINSMMIIIIIITFLTTTPNSDYDDNTREEFNEKILLLIQHYMNYVFRLKVIVIMKCAIENEMKNEKVIS
jgi:hypothetical protein